ncbi:hypothetical protein ABK040_011138 [Willaertia magna]
MTNSQSKEKENGEDNYNNRYPAGALNRFIEIYNVSDDSNNLINAGLKHTIYQWKDITTALSYGYIFFINNHFTLNYYPKHLDSVRGLDLQLWNIGTFLLYGCSFRRYLTKQELNLLTEIHLEKYNKKFICPYNYDKDDVYPFKFFSLHVNKYREKAQSKKLFLHQINHYLVTGKCPIGEDDVSHLTHFTYGINGEDTHIENTKYNGSRSPCNTFEILAYSKLKIILFLFNCNHTPTCQWIGKNCKGGLNVINKGNVNNYDLKEDLKLFKNLLFIKETNLDNEIMNYKLIYERGLKKKKDYNLLILKDDNNNYIIIFGTDNGIKPLKRLLKDYNKDKWNGEVYNVDWKNLKYIPDYLEDIDTNIQWPPKLDINNVDKNLLVEKNEAVINLRKENKKSQGSKNKRKRETE